MCTYKRIYTKYYIIAKIRYLQSSYKSVSWRQEGFPTQNITAQTNHDQTKCISIYKWSGMEAPGLHMNGLISELGKKEDDYITC